MSYSFEKIKRIYGLSESEVIKIMRKNLKSKSFKIWRERVSGRTRKHEKKRILSTKSEKIEEYVLQGDAKLGPGNTFN